MDYCSLLTRNHLAIYVSIFLSIPSHLELILNMSSPLIVCLSWREGTDLAFLSVWPWTRIIGTFTKYMPRTNNEQIESESPGLGHLAAQLAWEVELSCWMNERTPIVPEPEMGIPLVLTLPAKVWSILDGLFQVLPSSVKSLSFTLTSPPSPIVPPRIKSGNKNCVFCWQPFFTIRGSSQMES